MVTKLQQITNLSRQTAQELTRTRSTWAVFLKAAAWNYKYPFQEQVLIFAQKPDATACASIEFWNRKLGRWVNKGAKGIALIDDAGDRHALRHVFDVSDTNSRSDRPVPLWGIQERYVEATIEALGNTFGELESDGTLPDALLSAVSNAVEDNYADYLTTLLHNLQDSFLEDLDELNVKVALKKTLIASVSTMVLTRCGYDPDDYIADEDFLAVTDFNTLDTVARLGAATSDISEMVLREIEVTVRSLQRAEEKERRTFAKSKRPLHTERRDHDERKDEHGADLHSAGGLPAARPDATRGSAHWQVWDVAQNLPQEPRPGDVRQPDALRQTDGASDGDRPDGTGTGESDRIEAAGAGPGPGQGDRPDGLGGPHEQLEASGGGVGTDGVGLQLEWFDRETEDKSLPFFHATERINSILCETDTLKATKREIADYFAGHPDSAERTAYIRSIFPTGITELPALQAGYQPSENVLHLWEGSFDAKASQSYFDWRVIAGHYAGMILLGEFLDEPPDGLPSERQQMTLIEQAAAEKTTAFLIPQEAIDFILQRGSGVQDGKYRIAEQFARNASTKDNADFLKHEYGTGGQYPAITGTGIDEWHDPKGITLRRGESTDPNAKLLLTWPKVAKRIGELIAADRYLNPKEKEYLLTYQQQMTERRQQAAEEAYVRGILSRAPDLSVSTPASRDTARYVLPLGSTVYLGADEYEVNALGADVVSLRDARFPLLSKDLTRAEFDRLLRENPLNDHLIDTTADAGEPAEKESIILRADNPGVPDWVQVTGDILISHQGDTVTIDSPEPGDHNYVEMDVALPDDPEPSHLSLSENAPREAKRIQSEPLRNFRITDDNLGHGGSKAKYAANVTAIRLLKLLEAENRFADASEQEVLSRYVGWGGLPQAFDDANPQWAKEYTELKELLDSEVYELARGSTLNAHYTSPTAIKAIYACLENMGFRNGNVLEPACGIGNFFGLVPESMKDCKLYGVELDSITGRIAKQLYQNANIAVQGYETTNLPDSFFDLAIGNVPFGGYGVSDKKYDKHKFLIHDYFFAKTLDKVRPGGLIAFITSKGTLDKQSPEVRKYIAQRSDLLGAVRLPNNVFLANAGTEVTTDILFLQKRDRITDVLPAWVYLGETEDGITVNQYFADNPDMILGRMAYDDRMYGNARETTCLPHENDDLAEQLQEALENIHAEYEELDREEEGDEVADTSIPADPSVRNFSFTVVDGQIYFRENSRMNKVDTSITARGRIKGMVALRDCARELIERQLEDYGDDAIREQQQKLGRLYDIFVSNYGLLNSRGNEMAFSDDSSYALLCSLEVLDENGDLQRKADMFTKRTIKQRVTVSHVDTASEALAISIAEKACVDMGYMSSLTGLSEEQLESDLQGVIFRDTGDQDPADVPRAFYDLKRRPFVTADAYLSGNVRSKLRLAQELAKMRPDLREPLAVNIRALEAVQPADLSASEIDVRLGATWLPPDVVRDFMLELLETPYLYRKYIDVLFSEHTGNWNIKGKSDDRSNNIKANITYGTNRINAYKIIEETLNLKDVRIFDTVLDDNGKETRVLNKKETAIAQQKQEAIKDAFQNWVWEDPQRRERLTRLYNERFNSIRPREYDGSHIRFTGMNPEIKLRKHQVDAVAHILYGGNTLLAHCVGAGKTYEMTAAAMESKHLGLCSKSMFVVPNHLTEQWAAEFLQLYPSANILVATKKDFETKNRKKFCARIATGDYDAVIIGHSQFEKIPISAERQENQIREQIAEITSGIRELKENKGERYAIKQLEKTKKTLELRLKKLIETGRKDDVVTFEELGVDRLFVDEADTYKNLFLYTKMRNVAGLSQTEAQKSSDLYMKCRYLDELTGGRGVVFATGTPISNSITEMYTMQRYLQYETLRRHGLQHFDCWASTFGETITAIELAPEGTGYRAKTRFARFYNLPELMSMFREVADIKTADMLNLPVPKANYHNVAVKPSEFQRDMVADLATRAEKVRNRMVEPHEDNMLKITNDGRKLALDQRLANPMLPDDEASKVNACVDRVFEFWQQHQDKRLTQLVFCDLSTPKGDGTFNVYDDFREKLKARGVPPEEVAFIHEADTETRKKELYAKVRKGQVRVLIGTTFKMGAGTNVQDKLIASHDLDCPWRPRDLEQRAGRTIRQGNKNEEVHIFRYVTENTFDAYLYQILENKQRFISQIMTSKSPVRSAEDIDETALSYAEVKALATGNPYIKEKMDLDIQVSKLKLLKANHLSQRYALEDAVLQRFPKEARLLNERISGFGKDVTHLEQYSTAAAVSVARDDAQSKFAGMMVKGISYTEKAHAGAAILEACKLMTTPEPQELGSYLGFPMFFSFDSFRKQYQITLQGVLGHTVTLGTDVHGNITRLDNALADIPEKLEVCREQLKSLQQQLETAKEQIEVPFGKEEELQAKTARLAELNSLLNMDQQENVIMDAEPDEEAPEPERRAVGYER